jgi:hypothetical protein
VPETFVPILEAGLFDVVEGETEVLPGLSVVPLPGTTWDSRGWCCVRVGSFWCIRRI